MENEINDKKLEVEKSVPQRLYTKRNLISMLDKLETKMPYSLNVYTSFFEVVYYDDSGFRSIEINLKLKFDPIMTSTYRERYPLSSAYNVNGYEIIVTGFNTYDAKEAEIFLAQYKDAMEILRMFKEISEADSVIIINQ